MKRLTSSAADLLGRYSSREMDENRTAPLPPPPPPPPVPGPPFIGAPEPFYRRHGLAFAISTGVLALILLLGVVAVGTFAVASFAARAAHTVSQAKAGAPGKLAPVPAPGHGGNGPGGKGWGGPAQGKGIVRGTIVSLSGSSWKITTPNGATVTVVITSDTVFGPRSSSGSAADFRVGDAVIVLGTRTGNTVTAAQIVDATSLGLRPPSTPGAPTTPTP